MLRVMGFEGVRLGLVDASLKVGMVGHSASLQPDVRGPFGPAATTVPVLNGLVAEGRGDG